MSKENPIVLILTVGGSFQPIISSIQDNNPNKIFFLCSDDISTTKGSWRLVNGKGKPCIPRNENNKPLPSIVNQLELNENDYEIIKIKEFDDLEKIYSRSIEIIKEIKKKIPTSQIILDYTGGTKAMSAGLVAAGIEEEGIIFCSMRGTRADLIKIKSGTEQKWLIKNIKMINIKNFNRAITFAKKYEFDSAREILKELTNISNHKRDFYSQIIKSLDLVNAIDSWDKFNHDKALDLLSSYRKDYHLYIEYLQSLLNEKKILALTYSEDNDINSKPDHLYLLIWDMLNNAERRAKIGRYDDAVARLYRCLELIIQLTLRYNYKISTSDVPLTVIEGCSDFFREKYIRESKEKNKITYEFGLRASFDLLGEINKEDPIFEHFRKNQNKILDLLNLRNNSILAHGFTPIKETEFHNFYIFMEEFLNIIIDNNALYLKKFIKKIPKLTFKNIFIKI